MFLCLTSDFFKFIYRAIICNVPISTESELFQSFYSQETFERLQFKVTAVNTNQLRLFINL